jgi:SAM-dependent methyltransferase
MKAGMHPVQAPQFYVDADKPHLGGFIVGGDDATYFPELWRWLVWHHGVRSVLDVGCGEGHAIDYFRTECDCYAVGVDGVAQVSPWIHQTDFSEGPENRFCDLEFDLVWSCEFVEHVDEQYMPNYLPSFAQGRLILMTHAAPDQPGHHHVNCQPTVYWQGVMAAIGYRLNWDLTMAAREKSLSCTSPYNHFARSGLAFVRNV